MISKQIICLAILAASAYGQTYTRVNVSCSATSYWNNQWCVPCQSGCSCNTPGGCNQLVCQNGYAADQTSNTCVQCPTGCLSCTFSKGVGNFQCQSCSSGYGLIQNICVELVSAPILQDQAFDYIEPTNIPVMNTLSLCSQIDPATSLCQACPTGSYLNEANACENCVQGCSSCNSRGTCSQCSTGTQWIPNAYPNAGSNIDPSQGQFTAGSGACLPCSDPNAASCNQNAQNALTCNNGYYITTGGTYQTCTQCPYGCTACTSQSFCTSCSLGYYISNNLCSFCSANQLAKTVVCATCSSTSCSACNTAAGYYMVNNQCIYCSAQITGCAICGTSGSSFTCNTCQNGYYRVIDSTTNIATCIACSSSGQSSAQYCYQDDYSTLSSPVITQCGQSNLLVPQQSGSNILVCATNPNNCLTMNSAATQTCSTCWPNMFLLSNGTCVTCGGYFPGCTSCSLSSGILQCKTCVSGQYTPNPNDGCSNCSTQCASCQSTQQCTQCNAGYYLSGGTCSQCQVVGCSLCTQSNTCSTCFTGFFLYTVNGANTCQQCPYGCAECGPSGQSCTSCQSGFYLQNGGCSAGVQYCAVLSSSGTCTQCQYGFRLGNNGQCLACIGFNGGYVCNQNAALQCSANYLNWSLIVAIFVFLVIG